MSEEASEGVWGKGLSLNEMSLNEIKDVKLSIKRSDGALHYFYKPFVHFSFWLRWVFVAALGLSLVAEQGLQGTPASVAAALGL